MTTLTYIYISLLAFNIIFEPFLFGESKGTYTPLGWLIGIVIKSGLIYLLINTIK